MDVFVQSLKQFSNNHFQILVFDKPVKHLFVEGHKSGNKIVEITSVFELPNLLNEFQYSRFLNGDSSFKEKKDIQEFNDDMLL